MNPSHIPQFRQYQPGDMPSAGDMSALNRLISDARGVNGIEVYADGAGGLVVDGRGAGGSSWREMALGLAAFDRGDAYFWFNAGLLYHHPTPYPITGYTEDVEENGRVQVVGGTVDTPHYAVVRYTHRQEAEILPESQPNPYDSGPGWNDIPLCSVYLDEDENGWVKSPGGIHWVGDIILGAPIFG